MSVMTLVYPCVTLAARFDPWRMAGGIPAENGGSALPALEDVRRTVRAQLETLLETLPKGHTDGGEEDEKWYWAAPMLLDLQGFELEAREWLARAGLASEWRRDRASEADVDAGDAVEREPDTAWAQHVEEARKALVGALDLGRRPDDLADVLALQALGSPAVLALRSLCRVTEGLEAARQPYLRSLAGRVAHGFLSLFNQPEVTEAIRRRHADDDEVYWRNVLEYAAEGCLQAVLDEYAHVLVEWRGVTGKDSETIATRVAETMVDALTLRAAVVAADLFPLDEHTRRVTVSQDHPDVFRFRTRFAVRYGAQGREERRTVERQGELQTAFNSPFWPFVLCTTSVGQEGLDFHLYCHAVVHWNLPSNPVDLEQREGRIHRFKGHAVRKNIARVHGQAALGSDGYLDPWAAAFRAARDAREESASDLVPYWVYLADDGARIERHMPMLALSRDSHRADQLRKALAVYRMAFGQSRQEDLVAFLLDRVSSQDVERASSDIRIDLSPDPSDVRHESGEDLRPERSHVTRSYHRLAQAQFISSDTLNLDALRVLLDRFRQSRARQAHLGIPNGAASTPRVEIDALRELLDRFQQLKPARAAAERKGHTARLERWRALLDALAALLAPENKGAPLDRYRALLDDFTRAARR